MSRSATEIHKPPFSKNIYFASVRKNIFIDLRFYIFLFNVRILIEIINLYFVMK